MNACQWRKSSHSAMNGNCVEVRSPEDNVVNVRDSKNKMGPVLTFTPREWAEFLRGAKSGSFDI